MTPAEIHAIAEWAWGLPATVLGSDNVEIPDKTLADVEAIYPDWLAWRAGLQVREERDSLLTACDWTQIPDGPLMDEQRAAWTTYRQALRDVPGQAGFPATVEWPVPPA